MGGMPQWIRYLIDVGYAWQLHSTTNRYIIFLSMTCDSPAAGLVCLGEITAGLTIRTANETDGHYDSLLAYAKQYLDHCKSCALSVCDPGQANCGFSEKASGILRNKVKRRRKNLVSDSTNFDSGHIAIETPGSHRSGPITSYPSREKSLDWYIDGSPPVSAFEYPTALRTIYQILGPMPKSFRQSKTFLYRVLSCR